MYGNVSAFWNKAFLLFEPAVYEAINSQPVVFIYSDIQGHLLCFRGVQGYGLTWGIFLYDQVYLREN